MRRADYETMKAEIVKRLILAGAVDAFYFDVHGAMGVEELDDPEVDLLAAIRHHLPPNALVTCSQDLHGNVTDRLVAMTDILTAGTRRTTPHLDWMEDARAGGPASAAGAKRRVRPVRARVGIPVLVSGEMSSTTCEPGCSLYAPLEEESRRPGVWDASLRVGYAWADQPRAMAGAAVRGPTPRPWPGWPRASPAATGRRAAGLGSTDTGTARNAWTARWRTGARRVPGAMPADNLDRGGAGR
ncbi:MAG: M81 family metallopeptidase [Kiritimatiellia bacterium]